MLVITPRSANFEIWRINNKLLTVFGRSERVFNSSVFWVVTAFGEIIFQSGNSKGKNLFFRTFLYFWGHISSIQCNNLVTFEL